MTDLNCSATVVQSNFFGVFVFSKIDLWPHDPNLWGSCSHEQVTCEVWKWFDLNFNLYRAHKAKCIRTTHAGTHSLIKPRKNSHIITCEVWKWMDLNCSLFYAHKAKYEETTHVSSHRTTQERPHYLIPFNAVARRQTVVIALQTRLINKPTCTVNKNSFITNIMWSHVITVKWITSST